MLRGFILKTNTVEFTAYVQYIHCQSGKVKCQTFILTSTLTMDSFRSIYSIGGVDHILRRSTVMLRGD